MSIEKDAQFHKGEHWTFIATMVGPDGSPFPMTDDTVVTWQLQRTPGATPVVSRTSQDTGYTVLDASAGRIKIVIPPAAQSALVPGRYFWGLQADNPDLSVAQAHGNFTLLPPVTV